MRISDWSSDVCSSDLEQLPARHRHRARGDAFALQLLHGGQCEAGFRAGADHDDVGFAAFGIEQHVGALAQAVGRRSEEHTSELQSLMRISYAVFCLKKKKKHIT